MSESPTLETADQKASYGIGLNVGSSIASRGGLDVDTTAFLAGLRDGLAGAEPRLDDATIREAMLQLQAKADAARQQVAGKNFDEAKAWLAKNAQREEVTVTDSGLQYEILTAGDGPTPSANDTVEVHYHGTLIDGTVFDSSVERGETATFPVNRVIPGWVEALQLMPVGSKWRLFVPPDLAYGAQGVGDIPPNAALIFDVELIAIK
ncbi:MAG: FKBP-type peptidyl-prolyl cis-trans isomerase [Verrucomicrobia bacterium]|nr:MAG: FKBP-type peptidyl-prolyl cis-trans isomerase [Verrucomicrobiota bacterium]